MAEPQLRHRKAAALALGMPLDVQGLSAATIECSAQGLADQEERFIHLARELAREQEHNGRQLQKYDDEWTRREGRARVLAAGLFEDLALCLLQGIDPDEPRTDIAGRAARDLEAVDLLRLCEHKDELSLYFDGHSFCVRHRDGVSVDDDPADALLGALRPEVTLSPQLATTEEEGRSDQLEWLRRERLDGDPIWTSALGELSLLVNVPTGCPWAWEWCVQDPDGIELARGDLMVDELDDGPEWDYQGVDIPHRRCETVARALLAEGDGS